VVWLVPGLRSYSRKRTASRACSKAGLEAPALSPQKSAECSGRPIAMFHAVYRQANRGVEHPGDQVIGPCHTQRLVVVKPVRCAADGWAIRRRCGYFSETSSRTCPTTSFGSARATSAWATMPTSWCPSMTGRRRTWYFAMVLRVSSAESSAPIVTGLP
jgi:hypothetical protein